MPTILLPFIMIIIYDANNHNTLTYSRIYNTEKSHPFLVIPNIFVLSNLLLTFVVETTSKH